MAEFAKKLHFLKSGIEQTAKAYSTVDEVGELYTFTKIDGIDCYVPLTTKKYYKKGSLGATCTYKQYKLWYSNI